MDQRKGEDGLSEIVARENDITRKFMNFGGAAHSVNRAALPSPQRARRASIVAREAMQPNWLFALGSSRQACLAGRNRPGPCRGPACDASDAADAGLIGST